MLDQIHRQCGQSIVLTFRPSIFDLETAACANAGVNQSLLEGTR
jgi:hypothetical protein